MANIAFVQTQLREQFNVTTTTMTFSQQPVSGNLVVLMVAANNSLNGGCTFGTSAVTDNKGNTYTRAVTPGVYSSGTFDGTSAIYYLVIPSTYTGYTVTVAPTYTTHNVSSIFACMSEYSGQNATPLDQTASSKNASSTNPMPSGTTATTAANCELLCAIDMCATGTFTQWDAEPAGWTRRQVDTGASVLAAEARDNISSSANVSIAAATSWTVNTNNGHDYAASIATFASSQGVGVALAATLTGAGSVADALSNDPVLAASLGGVGSVTDTLTFRQAASLTGVGTVVADLATNANAATQAGELMLLGVGR